MRFSQSLLPCLVLMSLISSCQKPSPEDQVVPVPAQSQTYSPVTVYQDVSVNGYNGSSGYCSGAGTTKLLQIAGKIVSHDATGKITSSTSFSNIPGIADLVKDCSQFLFSVDYYVMNPSLYEWQLLSPSVGSVSSDCKLTLNKDIASISSKVRNLACVDLLTSLLGPKTKFSLIQTICSGNGQFNSDDYPYYTGCVYQKLKAGVGGDYNTAITQCLSWVNHGAISPELRITVSPNPSFITGTSSLSEISCQ